jgi:tryptophan halogenase
MKIKSICIVGGGSSGWMTAAALSKKLNNINITLIESKNIKTVGVGESTLGHINRFMSALGLEDKDWMPECNATYKVSIQFTDWKNKGTRYQYPFGKHDYTDKSADGLSDWYYIRNIDNSFTDETYAEFYNPITYLANTNKMVSDDNIIRNFNFKWDTAYHMDAELFGKYLRDKVCIPNGVAHIQDTVLSVTKDEDGNISSLITENSGSIVSDIYIDCTGFRSMLLENEMGSKFISFGDYLYNDSALACRIPYVDRENEMYNVTDCHAMKNGWVWNIPLWNRIGTGYCYSSKFTSRDEAADEFREHLAKTDKKRAEKAEFFDIKIRHGKRERAWVKNVIGIGLSYGFLEPLESTGLLTTHENILKLISILERRDNYVTKIDIDGFNYSVDFDLEAFKSFIGVHYVLSQRDDSEYWRQIKYNLNMIPDDWLTDGVVRTPRLYMELIHCSNVTNKFPDLSGTLYIAAGMGYHPIGKTQMEYEIHKKILDTQNLETIIKSHNKYKKQVLNCLNYCPSHFEFLRDYIYETSEYSF